MHYIRACPFMRLVRDTISNAVIQFFEEPFYTFRQFQASSSVKM